VRLRSTHGLTAAALAVGLVLLGTAPALAADGSTTGTATALRVSVAGNEAYSGTYSASNDGSTQTTSGSNKPQLQALGGQKVVTAGTLDQDAGTSVNGERGHVNACSGLAGSGSSLVEVGRASCLDPKGTVSLNAGAVDFSKFDPTTDVVNSALNKAITDNLPAGSLTTFSALTTTLATQLSTAFAQGFAALGNPGLSLDLGVAQARCAADPGDATGSSQLAGAKLVLTFPSQSGVAPLTLADLPVDPAPNTRVTTDLSALSKVLRDSLSTSLTTSLAVTPATSALAPLLTALNGTKALDAALDQISTQLGPVDQNIASLVLNRQSRPSDSSIRVTALALDVLPAAKAFVNSSLVSLEIGDVTCDAGRYAAAVSAPAAAPSGAVPTAIDSGLSGSEGHGHDALLTVLGVLLIIGAAGIGVRRSLPRSSRGTD
jgi:hypothetical protein